MSQFRVYIYMRQTLWVSKPRNRKRTRSMSANPIGKFVFLREKTTKSEHVGSYYPLLWQNLIWKRDKNESAKQCKIFQRELCMISIQCFCIFSNWSSSKTLTLFQSINVVCERGDPSKQLKLRKCMRNYFECWGSSTVKSWDSCGQFQSLNV